MCRRMIALVWMAVLVGSAPAGAPVEDDGRAADFAADPNPFSPGFSRKKMDTTALGYTLTRELPLFFQLYDGASCP